MQDEQDVQVDVEESSLPKKGVISPRSIRLSFAAHHRRPRRPVPRHSNETGDRRISDALCVVLSVGRCMRMPDKPVELFVRVAIRASQSVAVTTAPPRTAPSPQRPTLCPYASRMSSDAHRYLAIYRMSATGTSHSSRTKWRGGNQPPI